MILCRAWAASALVLVASTAFATDAPKPKLGPEAVPIFAATDYFRQVAAPDYWTLASFYVPQKTSSDCSAAAVTMAVNALRGLPAHAEDKVMTEDALLDLVNDAKWKSQVADEGPGVTFDDLNHALRESLDDAGMKDATLVAVQPTAADATALSTLRQALVDNEASAKNVMLVYFNQGVVTGDWDGPHISPVGAYDAAKDRVLIMDVDRDWYVPYWTPTATLLAALVKPSPADQGVLAGGTGGYLVATVK